MRHALAILSCALCLAACDDARYGSATRGAGDDAGADAAVEVGADSDTDVRDVEVADVPVADVDRPDDASPTGGVCELKIESEQGSGQCQIDARSMLGCDEMARCLCELTGPEVERCVQSLVFPRGAITLADFCSLSGTDTQLTLAEVIEEFSPEWFAPGGDVTLEASPECDEVAAFTLWGAEPRWNLSWEPNTREVPTEPWRLAEIQFDPLPLATLEDVVSYEAQTATLVLGGGRLGETAPNAAPRPALFVVHSDDQAFMVGLFWTVILSSLPPEGAPVVLYEQLTADSYETVRFSMYPMPGPARPPASTVGMHDANLAARGKLLDARCLSSCGCPGGRACRDGVCASAPRCSSDSDCCLAVCRDGVCQ